MSNNIGYTPGPWVWNEWTWLDGADGKPVLEYAGCGSHECEVNEANARLIAAAPALVEALKEAADVLEWTGAEHASARARAALRAAGVVL